MYLSQSYFVLCKSRCILCMYGTTSWYMSYLFINAQILLWSHHSAMVTTWHCTNAYTCNIGFVRYCMEPHHCTCYIYSSMLRFCYDHTTSYSAMATTWHCTNAYTCNIGFVWYKARLITCIILLHHVPLLCSTNKVAYIYQHLYIQSCIVIHTCSYNIIML